MYLHYIREFFRLSLDLYQYNVPHIPTLLTTIFVWFVLSDFKWLWLVAGNRCRYDDEGEDSVLDEDGGLTVVCYGEGTL